MKKWIGWAITLGGLGAMMVVIMGRVEEVKTARANPEKVVIPPASVRVAAVEARDLVRLERATGEVRARAMVHVIPKVGGRVLTLEKGLGDAVTAGDVLATLDAGDLNWRVKQGEAGAGAARAGVRQASVQLELARTELERAERLFRDNALAEADVVRARGGVKAAEAAVAGAKAQVTVADAGLGLAREALDWTRVTAPITGVITKRMADAGNMVGPQAPIFEIQDMSVLDVIVDLDAAAGRAVEQGAVAVARVDGAPGQVFPLQLKKSGRSLDPMTRKLRVEFEMPADAVEKGVMPFMVAHVQVEVPGDKGAMTAPANSVVALADGRAVFVARDGQARKIAVIEGASPDPKYVVLKSGEDADAARAGDRVIVEGHLDLKPDAPVSIVDAPNGGK